MSDKKYLISETSYPISADIRDLLKDPKMREFVQGAFDLGKKSPSDLTDKDFKPLKTIGTEAETTRRVLPSGDVEVELVIPFDDNGQEEDGRLYLHDFFTFDAGESKFKKYERTFSVNKTDSYWQGWLERFNETKKNLPNDAANYAMKIGRAYHRPFTPRIIQAFKQEEPVKGYINELKETVRSYSELTPSKGYSKHFYSLGYLEDGFQLTLNLSFKDSQDRERIYVQDRFKLSLHDETGATQLTFGRIWEAYPAFKEDPETVELIKKLNEHTDYSSDPSQVAESLFPYLQPMTTEEFYEPSQTTEPKKVQQPNTSRQKAQQEVLEVMFGVDEDLGVAGELVQHVCSADQGLIDKLGRWIKRDHSGGWSWKGKKETLKSLRAKTDDYLQSHPQVAEATLFDVLQKLDSNLTPEERDLKNWVVTQRKLTDLNHLSGEENDRLRTQGLSHLGMRYFNQKELANAGISVAQWVVTHRTDSKETQQAQRLLALAQGKGSIADKVAMTLKDLPERVLDPTMLVGMTSGGFIGVEVNTALLSTFVGRFAPLGIPVGAGIAVGASILTEALFFTLIEHAGKGLVQEMNLPKRNQFLKEVGYTALLLSASRLAHGPVGKGQSAVMRGRGPKTWSTPLELGEGESVLRALPLPSGHLTTDRITHALTPRGQFWFDAFNHTTGIAAMGLADFAAKKVGLRSWNQQGAAGDFVDAVSMYGVAMFGYGIANHLTGGAPHLLLRDVKRLNEVRAQRRGIAPLGRNGSEKVADVPAFGSKGEKEIHPLKFTFSVGKDKLGEFIPDGLIRQIWLGRATPDKPKGFRQAAHTLDIYLPSNTTVAEQHGVLMQDANGVWHIFDLANSRYGISVNEQKILPRTAHPLGGSSTIRLGDRLELSLNVEGTLPKPIEGSRFQPMLPVSRPERVPPPHPAMRFPTRLLGDNPRAKGGVEVAYLKSLEDGSIFQRFSSIQETILKHEVPDTGPAKKASAHWWAIYFDPDGRPVVIQEGTTVGVKLNGKAVDHWAFINDGDILTWGAKGEQKYQFFESENLRNAASLPKPEVSATAHATPIFHTTLDSVVKRYLNVTVAMGKTPEPVRIEQFAPGDLNELSPDMGPMTLRVTRGSRTQDFSAPNVTQYFIPDDFYTNPNAELRTSPSPNKRDIATIEFVELNGTRAWVIRDRGYGDIYVNGERLNPLRFERLRDGFAIVDGANPDGFHISFLKNSGSPSGSPPPDSRISPPPAKPPSSPPPAPGAKNASGQAVSFEPSPKGSPDDGSVDVDVDFDVFEIPESADPDAPTRGGINPDAPTVPRMQAVKPPAQPTGRKPPPPPRAKGALKTGANLGSPPASGSIHSATQRGLGPKPPPPPESKK